MNEIITGHMPFSAISSPGMLVQKYVEQGKRPSLKVIIIIISSAAD